jgi:hypothetical protein
MRPATGWKPVPQELGGALAAADAWHTYSMYICAVSDIVRSARDASHPLDTPQSGWRLMAGAWVV